MRHLLVILAASIALAWGLADASEDQQRFEVSSDGLERVVLDDRHVAQGSRSDEVPFLTTPDWFNNRRVQVGGLDAADIDGDGDVDVVVGCYHSNSYPPYPDWENLIYRNIGGNLEVEPSWISTDERLTGDIHVAFINTDAYPDIVSANGGFTYDATVDLLRRTRRAEHHTRLVLGGPGGWNNYVIPFDFDHDGDVDVVTANQGNSESDPYRPMYVFFNNAARSPPRRLAVSRGLDPEFPRLRRLRRRRVGGPGGIQVGNFESGIYRNVEGALPPRRCGPPATPTATRASPGRTWTATTGPTSPSATTRRCSTDNTAAHADPGTGPRAPATTATATYASATSTWTATRTWRRSTSPTARGTSTSIEAGVLDSAPSWTYDSTAVGTAIAFADISGDGMPDLILGFSGDTSVAVFFNQLPGPAIFSDGFEGGDTSAWSEAFE